jgi:tRNA (adenine22-N1)-methyltransferase
MELSSRLLKVASMVDKCECLADIGTDHAYIPIFLIKEGRCNNAIASDINEGPINKAVNNITQEGLGEKIECRLGGGFKTIKPFETNVAIIAGMGGNLIRDIINENIEVFQNLECCVVQPVQNPEVLRKYIYNKGFTIIDEEIVIEDNKFYEIIKLKFGNKVQQIESIYYEVAKKLFDKNHYLLRDFINFKIDKYNSINVRLTDNSLNSQTRKAEVINKINDLKGLLNLCH